MTENNTPADDGWYDIDSLPLMDRVEQQIVHDPEMRDVGSALIELNQSVVKLSESHQIQIMDQQRAIQELLRKNYLLTLALLTFSDKKNGTAGRKAKNNTRD